MTGSNGRRRRSAGALAAGCALAVLGEYPRICGAISAIVHRRNLCGHPGGLCQEQFERMRLCVRPKALAIHPNLVLFPVLGCL